MDSRLVSSPHGADDPLARARRDRVARAVPVAWALVDGEDGGHEVVGLVVSPDDPTKILPAPEAASAIAPEFDRYGFRRE
jgi:hypothetical protein